MIFWTKIPLEWRWSTIKNCLLSRMGRHVKFGSYASTCLHAKRICGHQHADRHPDGRMEVKMLKNYYIYGQTTNLFSSATE